MLNQYDYLPKIRKTKVNKTLVDAFRLYAQIQNAEIPPEIKRLQSPRLFNIQKGNKIQLIKGVRSAISSQHIPEISPTQRILNQELKVNFFSTIKPNKDNSVMKRSPVVKRSQQMDSGRFELNIKPKFMMQQGSMCVTDLWSEYFKRQLTVSNNWAKHIDKLQSVQQHIDSASESESIDLSHPSSRNLSSSNAKMKLYKLVENYQKPLYAQKTPDQIIEEPVQEVIPRFQTEPPKESYRLLFKSQLPKNKLKDIESSCEEFIQENGKFKSILTSSHDALNSKLQRFKRRL